MDGRTDGRTDRWMWMGRSVYIVYYNIPIQRIFGDILLPTSEFSFTFPTPPCNQFFCFLVLFSFTEKELIEPTRLPRFKNFEKREKENENNEQMNHKIKLSLDILFLFSSYL